MSRVESRPNWPIGKARELNQFRQEHPRSLIRFVPVANEVVKVNPDILYPFNLRKGKPTALGVFAHPDQLENLDNANTSLQLESMPNHNRSALIGRILFSDKKGNLYRDIDIKGCGYINYHGFRVKQPGRIYKHDRINRDGLLEYQLALYDSKMSEKLLKLGIRTSRTIAIVVLKEIVVGTEKLPVVQLRNYNHRRRFGLGKNFRPAVEIRAFGTKTRIKDVSEVIGSTTRLIIDDAKELIFNELDIGRKLSDAQYLRWFSRTLGENLGLLHKQGWTHNYLNPHNITLDCRIVDLDSIEQHPTKSQFKADLEQAQDSLTYLYSTIRGLNFFNKFPNVSYQKAFMDSYQQTIAS